MLRIQILERSVMMMLRRFVLIKAKIYAHTIAIVQMASSLNLCVEKEQAKMFGRQLEIWKMIGFKSQTPDFANDIQFCMDLLLGTVDAAITTRCYVVTWRLTLPVNLVISDLKGA